MTCVCVCVCVCLLTFLSLKWFGFKHMFRPLHVNSEMGLPFITNAVKAFLVHHVCTVLTFDKA